MEPLDFTTIVDTALNILARRASDDHSQTGGHRAKDGSIAHLNVDRSTLRQILLAGLEDVCHFGARFTHYESDPDGVTTHFADGRTVRANVLIGADGINSHVREQRAPEALIMDTGVRAIYGRIPMDVAAKILPTSALQDVFTVASGPERVFLGVGPVAFPNRPQLAQRRISPSANLRDQDDYVVCIVGGRQSLFGHDDGAIRAMNSGELQSLAVSLLDGWPENARAVPTGDDPSSFFYVELRSSVPFELSIPTNVTLLGDAIHAMTPTLGRGANTAMHDAVMLSRVLYATARGELEVAEALAAYEREMTDYGFAVVRQSAALGERLIGQAPLPA
jgi:2-polyprenyl-6-methoxyphenol hydroxylase-like FAD-dependent oxidoreductase